MPWPGGGTDLRTLGTVAAEARSYAELAAPYFNVKQDDFGAVGDNVADDTNAVAAAIAAAFDAGGGVVFFPRGTYKLTSTIRFPYKVSFLGEGRDATFLRWATTLGADVWGADYKIDGTIQTYNLNFVQDLTLRGPAHGASLEPYGTEKTNMHGLRIGRRTVLNRVNISGFKKGIGIDSDHNWFYSVGVGACHWNVSIEPGTGTNFGNHMFVGCDLAASTYASVYVTAAGSMQGSGFYDTHFGFGPYGFYGEPGRSNTNFMLGILLINSPFEAIGNAAIRGDDVTNHVLKFLKVIRPGTSVLSFYRIPSTDYEALIDVSSMDVCEIDSDAFFAGTPTVSYIRTNGTLGDTEFTGHDLGSLSASPPFHSGGASSVQWHHRGRKLGGFVGSVQTTVSAGQLLRTHGSANVTLHDGTEQPVGFAYDASSGIQKIRVQTYGRVTATAGAAISAAKLVKPGAGSGKVLEATNWSDGPILGIARTAAAGDGSTFTLDIYPPMGFRP